LHGVVPPRFGEEARQFVSLNGTGSVAIEVARSRGGRCLLIQARAQPGVQGGNQEVNIVTTRFGLIQASESDLLRIPEGLLGFRSYTQYLHLPDSEVAGLSWLQSVTAPDLAFGLVAPPLAVSDYRIEIRPGDRAALELEDERTALIYVILNRGMGGGLTVNLQGPLVFNPVRRLGRQLVLTSSRYPVRYPLETYATAPAPAPTPTLLPGLTALRATA
jgi:flagellar assembly factor FliW